MTQQLQLLQLTEQTPKRKPVDILANYFERDREAFEARIEPDICRNNHKGNPESEAANRTTRKIADQGILLAYLRHKGSEGATSDEMEALFGLPHQTCSARCSELLRNGKIRRKPTSDGSTYYTRPTRTGRLAAVLVIV